MLWCSICIFLLPEYESVAVFMLQTALVKHVSKLLAVPGISKSEWLSYQRPLLCFPGMRG